MVNPTIPNPHKENARYMEDRSNFYRTTAEYVRALWAYVPCFHWSGDMHAILSEELQRVGGLPR